MKNSIVMLMALCASSPLLARMLGSSSAVELLNEFHTMQEGHKDDWLNFMEKNSTAKTELIKKQKSDWATFRKEQNSLLAGLTEFSEATKNAYFNNQLRAAVALHEKHMIAWEKWADKKRVEAKKLCDKHKSQLAQFKKQLK